MKIKMKLVILLLTSLFTAQCSDKTSASPVRPELKGTESGGGGSVGDIQRALLAQKKAYLVSELKRLAEDRESSVGTISSTVHSFLMNIDNYPELSVKIIEVLKNLMQMGLLADIRETKIIPSEKCVDMYGDEKSATSAMNVRAADICLNPGAVVEDLGIYIPDSALIALFIHEYIHHFGIEDKDYALAVDIAKAVQSESDRLMGQGVSSDNLIRPYLGF